MMYVILHKICFANINCDVKIDYEDLTHDSAGVSSALALRHILAYTRNVWRHSPAEPLTDA